MAEDEVMEEIPEEEEDTGEEILLTRRRPGLKKCNQRIDELATPPRRMFLSLWNEHAYHFPDEKVNNLKQLLQRLYAMTPEETAKYFAELKAQAKAAAKKKKMKQTVRKYLTEKNNEKQKNKAFRVFRRILKQGLRYAVETPVPPVLSIRLRYLSDIILEQLCHLRGLEVPDRAKCDHCGQFLISVADWIAIAVERLYYKSQLEINKITDNVKNEELPPQRESSQNKELQPKAELPSRKEIPPGKQLPPKKQLSPRKQLPPKKELPQKLPSYNAMGSPMASSTPQGSVEHAKISSFNQPIASPTKKNSTVQQKNVLESTTYYETANDQTPDKSEAEKYPFYSSYYMETKDYPKQPIFDVVTKSFYRPQQFKELTMISKSKNKTRKRSSKKKNSSSVGYSKNGFSKDTTKRIDSVMS